MADTAFSLYIRQRDADANGYVKCVTCDRVNHYKKMDAGHFCSRKKEGTRYDDRNVFTQCKRCNIFMSGNKPEFAIFLMKRFGEGIVEDLVKTGNLIVRRRAWDYEELITRFKELNGSLYAYTLPRVSPRTRSKSQ